MSRRGKFRLRNGLSAGGFSASGEDPMSGASNLFDIAIVFITAVLLISGGAALKANGAARTKVGADKQKIERFRASGESGAGEGIRVGAAYRLDNGEIVCVPGQ